MSRANPVAIYDAINAGGTYANGYVVISGVANKCLLVDGVWSLDPANGVLFYNEAHFNRMKAPNQILTDPGTEEAPNEYLWCIADADGNALGQLALVNGKAKILDP